MRFTQVTLKSTDNFFLENQEQTIKQKLITTYTTVMN